MPPVRTIAIPSPPFPADAARRLARTPGLTWLDGGLDHGREGRFSYVATAPCEVRASTADERDPLALLRHLENAEPSSREPAPLAAEQIPRWVGHVSYDAALPERLRAQRLGPVPAVRFARYDAWYVFDHESGEAFAVGDDDAACERLVVQLRREPLDGLKYEAGPVEATDPERHADAVRAAGRLIREGELYEINLARRLRAPFSGSALGLFLRMRELSPVPFGYFVDGGEHAVLGRSMERFLRYRSADRAIWTSPIKGTLARSGDDASESAQLRSDPKEHAEHAMVVDLMRNDLSRVCEVGSVAIEELMTVFPFAGLSHLISTVHGRVRERVTLHELLSLTLPPGSVTGTPKLRVLSAIEELEQVARGVYTGCYGFIDRAGGCSFAVAIRTAVVAEGFVSYFAGGGIVADSDPAREVAETELKARLFREALETR